MIDPLTVQTVLMGSQVLAKAGMSIAQTVALMKAGVTWEQALQAAKNLEQAAKEHASMNKLTEEQRQMYDRRRRELAEQIDANGLLSSD